MTMEIGTRIRQLRETKGFSQQVVADHLDITQNTITKLKVIISKGYCINTTVLRRLQRLCSRHNLQNLFSDGSLTSSVVGKFQFF